MTFKVEFTPEADADLDRLFDFLLEGAETVEEAMRAYEAIAVIRSVAATQALAAFIGSPTYAELRPAEILDAALAPGRAPTRTFLGFSRDHQPTTPPAVSFTDAAPWKAKQRYG